MKSIYALLIGICLLMIVSLKAQTTVQGDITLDQTPIFMHDSAACYSWGMMYYTITINNSFLNDTVWIVDAYTHLLVDTAINHSAQNPWVVSFNYNGGGYGGYYYDDEWLNNTPGSVFMNGDETKIINIHSNTSLDTMYNIYNVISDFVNNPCTFGTVSGSAYIDNNSNCTFDGSDVALTGIYVSGTANLVSPSPTSSQTSSAYVNNGTYNLTVQQSYMTNYAVQLPPSYAFIFPSSLCAPAVYNFTTLSQTNVDFPLQCTSNIDVACYATSTGIVRPNVPFMMHPYVANTGCVAASGILKFVLDNRVVYTPGLSSNPASSVNGDTLMWNFANLNNLSSGGYWNSFMAGVHLTPNTSVNVGDTLCFSVIASAPSGDIDPTNNSYTICLPVVASYDPNLKEVSPKGDGVTGDIPSSTEKLFYTIHFQNTGTAEAYNISVIDTLDGDVIPQSLQILGSSHNVSPEWLAPGVVQFNFNNIYLPDSTSNEPESHGSIRFSVDLNQGLAAGTQIKNTAYIYFDYNTPVVTNTVLNTIMDKAGINEHSANVMSVKVYPNPFNEQTSFVIEGARPNETYSFEMFDILGKKVVDMPSVPADKFNIMRNGLVNGVYFYKIKAADRIMNTGKVVVQ